MSVLESVTRRAGAVMDHRSGVAAHYGSPAGELGVCAGTVGMADRSHLEKLEFRTTAPASENWIVSVAGAPLDQGACRIAAGGRLCARSMNRVVVLAEEGAALLPGFNASTDAIAIADRTADWAVVGLAGPAATVVLSRLGGVSEFNVPGTFAPVTIAGAGAELALPSPRLAFLITEIDSAQDAWHAIEDAGKSAHLSYVGSEAFRRYALHDLGDQARSSSLQRS